MVRRTDYRPLKGEHSQASLDVVKEPDLASAKEEQALDPILRIEAAQKRNAAEIEALKDRGTERKSDIAWKERELDNRITVEENMRRQREETDAKNRERREHEIGAGQPARDDSGATRPARAMTDKDARIAERKAAISKQYDAQEQTLESERETPSRPTGRGGRS